MNIRVMNSYVTRGAVPTAIAVAATLSASGCGLLGNNVMQLSVGDCIADEDLGLLVEDVQTISCEEPHHFEVYGSMEMEDGDFPGQDVIDETSNEFCDTEFESFIGVPYAESEIYLNVLYPTEQSWELGDREILCLAYDPETQTTGSLQGANR